MIASTWDDGPTDIRQCLDDVRRFAERMNCPPPPFPRTVFVSLKRYRQLKELGYVDGGRLTELGQRMLGEAISSLIDYVLVTNSSPENAHEDCPS